MLVLLLPLFAVPGPRHLVVLQHGLYGSPTNLIVLERKLNAMGGEDVLVHNAVSNEGRTRDGVLEGGRRLAAEVRAVVSNTPSLRSLSLVGNSLGGLYVRACAAELFDTTTGRLAGLEADALVTLAAPHLGVRRHLYAPLPELPRSVLHPAAQLVAGQTAEELLLLDGGGVGSEADEDDDALSAALLIRMCSPSPDRYGASLAAFRRRRAYANLRGDFMVPFGTAAVEPAWGWGYADEERARDFERSPHAVYVNRDVCDGELDGIAVVCEVPAASPAEARAASGAGGVDDRNGEQEQEQQQEQQQQEEQQQQAGWERDAPSAEARMARGLGACGWSKVGCSFSSVMGAMAPPLAHNRLAALRREGWRQGFGLLEQTELGEPFMEHAARFVLDREPSSADQAHGGSIEWSKAKRSGLVFDWS